nr:hypothetical protein [Tanacetum cinerariifolium]
EEDPVDYPTDGGDDDDDKEGSSEDDDMYIEVDEEEEEEEHPALADSIVVASTAADQAPSAEETEPFETDDITIIPLVFTTASDSFSTTTPILSPPSPVLSPAPPPNPIRSLGYRAAMIRLRAEAASTSHSPSLPPPFILSPTRSDAPSSGTPLLLPISASTSSQPLQLPSVSRREDRPEVTLPPRKRLGIALGPGYEVGESSSAAAARPAGVLRVDYGFVATIDKEIMRDPERETERQLLPGQLNMLFRDRRAHAYTRHLMETEARMSREAWVRSTDASDLVCGEVMSLRTTILGQMTEFRELHAVDHRRQIVISELLREDHRRYTKIIEGQQGFARGPTQPELPEEAGSGS